MNPNNFFPNGFHQMATPQTLAQQQQQSAAYVQQLIQHQQRQQQAQLQQQQQRMNMNNQLAMQMQMNHQHRPQMTPQQQAAALQVMQAQQQAVAQARLHAQLQQQQTQQQHPMQVPQQHQAALQPQQAQGQHQFPQIGQPDLNWRTKLPEQTRHKVVGALIGAATKAAGHPSPSFQLKATQFEGKIYETSINMESYMNAMKTKIDTVKQSAMAHSPQPPAGAPGSSANQTPSAPARPINSSNQIPANHNVQSGQQNNVPGQVAQLGRPGQPPTNAAHARPSAGAPPQQQRPQPAQVEARNIINTHTAPQIQALGRQRNWSNDVINLMVNKRLQLEQQHAQQNQQMVSQQSAQQIQQQQPPTQQQQQLVADAQARAQLVAAQRAQLLGNAVPTPQNQMNRPPASQSGHLQARPAGSTQPVDVNQAMSPSVDIPKQVQRNLTDNEKLYVQQKLNGMQDMIGKAGQLVGLFMSQESAQFKDYAKRVFQMSQLCLKQINEGFPNNIYYLTPASVEKIQMELPKYYQAGQQIMQQQANAASSGATVQGSGQLPPTTIAQHMPATTRPDIPRTNMSQNSNNAQQNNMRSQIGIFGAGMPAVNMGGQGAQMQQALHQGGQNTGAGAQQHPQQQAQKKSSRKSQSPKKQSTATPQVHPQQQLAQGPSGAIYARPTLEQQRHMQIRQQQLQLQQMQQQHIQQVQQQMAAAQARPQMIGLPTTQASQIPASALNRAMQRQQQLPPATAPVQQVMPQTMGAPIPEQPSPIPQNVAPPAQYRPIARPRTGGRKSATDPTANAGPSSVPAPGTQEASAPPAETSVVPAKVPTTAASVPTTGAGPANASASTNGASQELTTIEAMQNEIRSVLQEDLGIFGEPPEDPLLMFGDFGGLFGQSSGTDMWAGLSHHDGPMGGNVDQVEHSNLDDAELKLFFGDYHSPPPSPPKPEDTQGSSTKAESSSQVSPNKRKRDDSSEAGESVAAKRQSLGSSAYKSPVDQPIKI